MTIGKMFPFKDNVKNTDERSLVVYSLMRSTCGAEYIGKIELILCHCIKEHRNNRSFALKQHIDSSPAHRVGFDKVQIVDSADNDKKCA